MFKTIDLNSSSLQLMLSRIRKERKKREECKSKFYNFDFSACTPSPSSSSATRGKRFRWEPVTSEAVSQKPATQQNEAVLPSPAAQPVGPKIHSPENAEDATHSSSNDSSPRAGRTDERTRRDTDQSWDKSNDDAAESDLRQIKMKKL